MKAHSSLLMFFEIFQAFRTRSYCGLLERSVLLSGRSESNTYVRLKPCSVITAITSLKDLP